MSERFQSLAGSVLQNIRAGMKGPSQVEHCGLLLAVPGASAVVAQLAYPGPLWPREFRLPEEWLLQVFLQQRTLGYEVAGFYHTHPAGESLKPSPADRAGHPPGSLVLLVGFDDWQAYRVSGHRWLPLALELDESL